MKTVRNKTHRPLRVPLPLGKVLHLGPQKTGQVAAGALEHEPFRKLVAAGELEIIDEGGAGVPQADGAAPIHESTHGNPQQTVVHPKGNR